MRTGKAFSKSQASTSNQRTADISRKEQQTMLEASAKYDRFKKSASLPAYYLNQARLKKITQIYRTLSSDKLHHSSKSRRSPAATLPRHPAPFTPLNLNAIDQAKPKSRLTIQRGENTPQTQTQSQHASNSAWGQLINKLRGFSERFQELLTIRSQEIFMMEMDKCSEDVKSKGNKKGEEVSSCLKAFGECLARRERIKVSDVRKQFAAISTSLSDLQVELKKKTIRAMLDQKEIERQQITNKDMQNQLSELKKKLTKDTKDVSCGTMESSRERPNDNQQLIFANTEVLTIGGEDGNVISRPSCHCNQQLERKTIKLAECMHRLQKYSRRQKELLAVLVVLRSQGVDVERIYDDVIQGRIEVAQNDESSMLSTVNQVKSKERKNQKLIRAAVKSASEFDADNSIISSADGLSFNYDQKSLEEDVFTVRREYKCKHQLQPALKQQLRLNFDVLYDEQLYDDDYESQSDMASNPPTI